jgi:hypothetical protein
MRQFEILVPWTTVTIATTPTLLFPFDEPLVITPFTPSWIYDNHNPPRLICELLRFDVSAAGQSSGALVTLNTSADGVTVDADLSLTNSPWTVPAGQARSVDIPQSDLRDFYQGMAQSQGAGPIQVSFRVTRYRHLDPYRDPA